MSCGVCDPKGLAKSIGVDGVRHIVVGYCAGRGIETRVARLYFLGASIVFFDTHLISGQPALKRPGLRRAHRVLRKGDVFLIDARASLGRRQADVMAEMEGSGVDVRIDTGEDVGWSER
jgi:dienelactone hydrolase